MLTRKEGSEVLRIVEPNHQKDGNYSLSFRLAQGPKSKRRKHIKEGLNNHECLISAAIEISRVWRGYMCR